MSTDETKLAAKVKELENCVKDARMILAQALFGSEAQNSTLEHLAHGAAEAIKTKDRQLAEADQSHNEVTYKEAETRIPDPVTLADVLRRTSATGHLLDLREKVEELRVRWRHTCFTERAEPDLQVFILLGLYRAMCALLELEPDVEG